LYSRAYLLSWDNQHTSVLFLSLFANQAYFLASRLQRRPSIRIAFIIIALAAAAAFVIGDFVRRDACLRRDCATSRISKSGFESL
jgi:hypothetical protein